jgi:hypothetical protein
MSEENCVKIKILKQIPLFGSGNSLESRLRNVKLKGFPEVCIYKNAIFKTVFLTPEQILSQLHTPQPSVYKPHLNKIKSLAQLFQQQKIDITNLDSAYDFIAESQSGEKTQWTMLPPITEIFHIPSGTGGILDYQPLIGVELKRALDKESLGINRDTLKIKHTSYSRTYNLINDGSHRIHHGFLNSGIKVISISGITPGFPYYAVPQQYSSVAEREKRDDQAIETKIHVIESPGHKMLYRLFPSGGIISGEIRYDPILKQ